MTHRRVTMLLPQGQTVFHPQKILRYPPTQNLTTEEKDLLWKFRFYLTRDKKVQLSYFAIITG